jgi:hypothetical protein
MLERFPRVPGALVEQRTEVRNPRAEDGRYRALLITYRLETRYVDQTPRDSFVPPPENF